MKPTLISLIICLFCLTSHAQVVFRIDSLPTDGIVLENGWRWHTGNVPDAASPTLNDRGWVAVPANATVGQLPGFEANRTGWLRLSVVLDSAVARQSLSIRLFHRRAVALYLDGVLFRRLGPNSPQDQTPKAMFAPRAEFALLPPLAAGRHTLAVRVAYAPAPWYIPNRILRLGAVLAPRLLPTQGLAAQQADQYYGVALGNYGLLGFFLAMAIIYLFYYSYRRNPASLLFSLTMFLGVFRFVTSELPRFTTSLVAEEWYLLATTLLINLYFVALLLVYYRHFDQRPQWLYWATAVVMLAGALLATYTPFDYTNYTFPGSIAVLFYLGMRLSIRSVRHGRKDARIMLVSLAIIIVVLTGQLALETLFKGIRAAYPALGEANGIIFFLTVPLTLALILARENARTNQELTRNLAEVKTLSAEKEQMLTGQKALLEQQVTERTAALNQSLADLRATQAQLVQREKMASLGELTAGIAHEIQNPLNFVNNFTEVSAELVAELADEHARPAADRDEALQTDLLTDLTQNLGKIGHHGNRAAAIVRGMLEHSRASTGQREPADLNALADEYLRLSYHGLRRTDDLTENKSLNVRLLTAFDPALPLTPVVAQDIGRVLLNLFNNAFYAVQQRARQTTSPGYEPTVTVQTEHIAGNVIVVVTDNGTGIPDAVKAKVFQPFFTTKPTGEGTGLGLSLSYDIITKGHGGSLTVTSEEGVGSTFRIELG